MSMPSRNYLRAKYLMVAITVCPVVFGCTARFDEYEGDVKDVAVVVQYANGARGTFHIQEGPVILPAGDVVAVKVWLNDHPAKEFDLPLDLARQGGLIRVGSLPPGGIVAAVDAARVRIRCERQSTRVVLLSKDNE